MESGESSSGNDTSRKYFTVKPMSFNNYQFARRKTTSETPANVSIFEEENEVYDDSESIPAGADWCRTAKQTDNDLWSTLPTER